MKLSQLVKNSLNAATLLPDATASRNVRVLSSLLGPSYRGLILQKGKNEPETVLPVAYETIFDWKYQRGRIPKMQQLYEMAKTGQWNAAKDIDWSIEVNPTDEKRPILPDKLIPTGSMDTWQKMTNREIIIRPGDTRVNPCRSETALQSARDDA